MKKEKEWAQKEVDRYLSYEGVNEARNALMFAKGVISQLEEPETLNEEWINEHSKCYTMENTVEISDLKNLLLPQPKKPVIPKFVADWIDTHNLYGNNPLREYKDLENDFNEGWTNEEDATVYHWINKNPYAFIDALRYGYEVEKEKKYYVLDYEDIPLLERANNQTCKTTTALSIYEDGRDNSRFALTEKEIEDYDDRFWQFAVPVEEVTE